MFSERLKTEREALGMSQQALAERLGIALRSQQNYEAGSRVPDATYLTHLGELGADVLFLVSGVRTPKPLLLDAAEQALVESYRRCNHESRISLIQTAALCAAGLTPGTGRAPAKKAAQRIISAAPHVGAISQVTHNDDSVQVGYAGDKVTVKKVNKT